MKNPTNSNDSEKLVDNLNISEMNGHKNLSTPTGDNAFHSEAISPPDKNVGQIMVYYVDSTKPYIPREARQKMRLAQSTEDNTFQPEASSPPCEKVGREMCSFVDKRDGREMCHIADMKNRREMCRIVAKSPNYGVQVKDSIACNQPSTKQNSLIYQSTINGSKQIYFPAQPNVVLKAQPIDPGSIPLTSTNICPINPDVNNTEHLYQTNFGNFHYEDGNMSFNGEPFMNAVVAIQKIVQKQNKAYYVCTIKVKGISYQKEIPVSTFGDRKWLYNILGFAKFDGKSMDVVNKYLNLLVAMNHDIIEFEVLKPGWTKMNDNSSKYLTPTGAIGYANFACHSKHGVDWGITDINSTGRLSDLWTLIKITPNSHVSIIMILYAIQSFCYTLYKHANFVPKYLLFLLGKSGSMKTSIAKVLSQIGEKAKSVTYTFKSTPAGIETGFKDTKDAIMLIDDLAPTTNSSQKKEMLNIFELLTRNFGDGTGKKRNNDYLPDGKYIEQYESQGGAVITGEYFEGVESSAARALILNLSKDDIDTKTLSIVQNDYKMFTRFMYGFILYTSANFNNIIQQIKDFGEKYRNEKINAYSHSRYAEYNAQLNVAKDLLIHFLVETQQISYKDGLKYDSIFHAAIDNVIEQNSRRLSMFSPISVLCNSIVFCIDEGIWHVFPVNDREIHEKKFILEDSQYFYVKQSDLVQIYNAYNDKNAFNNLNYSSTALANLLEQHQIISKQMEGSKPRFGKKLPGHGNVRFIMIDKLQLRNNTAPA